MFATPSVYMQADGPAAACWRLAALPLNPHDRPDRGLPRRGAGRADRPAGPAGLGHRRRAWLVSPGRLPLLPQASRTDSRTSSERAAGAMPPDPGSARTCDDTVCDPRRGPREALPHSSRGPEGPLPDAAREPGGHGEPPVPARRRRRAGQARTFWALQDVELRDRARARSSASSAATAPARRTLLKIL